MPIPEPATPHKARLQRVRIIRGFALISFVIAAAALTQVIRGDSGGGIRLISAALALGVIALLGAALIALPFLGRPSDRRAHEATDFGEDNDESGT